jgi:hypothetical protein
MEEVFWRGYSVGHRHAVADVYRMLEANPNLAVDHFDEASPRDDASIQFRVGAGPRFVCLFN